MSNVFLKPARNAAGEPMLIRDPGTRKPLDPAGETKPATSFWLRRIRDQDVIVSEPPAPQPAEPSPAKPAKAEQRKRG